jgi:hypothetical protein
MRIKDECQQMFYGIGAYGQLINIQAACAVRQQSAFLDNQD